MAFLDVVHEAVREHHAQQQEPEQQPAESSSGAPEPLSELTHLSTHNHYHNNNNHIPPKDSDSKPPAPRVSTASAQNYSHRRRSSAAAHYRDASLDSQSVSAATRSGPPRSLSYNYYTPSAAPRQNITSHSNLKSGPGTHVGVDQPYEDGFPFPFENGSGFRGALDTPGAATDRKGKHQRRESKSQDEPWTLNPMRWFAESPRESPIASPVIDKKRELDNGAGNQNDAGDEELGQKDTAAGKPGPSGQQQPGQVSNGIAASSSEEKRPSMQHNRTTSRELTRSLSQPSTSRANRPGLTKWNRLRSMLLPNLIPQPKSSGVAAVSGTQVNITDELMVSGLSTLMLRLWFDRDDKGHRRVPVLLQRLRIRVSDSLHPLHGSKSVFRIECEYANGAARWVIYRQLRDFVSLHAHYKFSNVFSGNADKLPEFPRTS
jgi:phospholipase D1/2